jgi:uncharacterized protein YbcC (UPF0753/DUF2309 family)
LSPRAWSVQEAYIFPSRSVSWGALRREITLDIRISRSEIAPDLELSEQAILETAHSANDIPQAIPTVADLAARRTQWNRLANLVTERIGTWAQCHLTPNLWAQRLTKAHGTVGGMGHGGPDGNLRPSGFRDTISNSQHDHWRAIGDACAALGIDNDAAPSVFHRLLCDLGGWAGLGRYRLWEAERAQTRTLLQNCSPSA